MLITQKPPHFLNELMHIQFQLPLLLVFHFKFLMVFIFPERGGYSFFHLFTGPEFGCLQIYTNIYMLQSLWLLDYFSQFHLKSPIKCKSGFSSLNNEQQIIPLKKPHFFTLQFLRLFLGLIQLLIMVFNIHRN